MKRCCQKINLPCWGWDAAGESSTPVPTQRQFKSGNVIIHMRWLLSQTWPTLNTANSCRCKSKSYWPYSKIKHMWVVEQRSKTTLPSVWSFCVETHSAYRIWILFICAYVTAALRWQGSRWNYPPFFPTTYSCRVCVCACAFPVGSGAVKWWPFGVTERASAFL